MYNVTDEVGMIYSFYNPDFNFKEFKSNLVARWEFVPRIRYIYCLVTGAKRI